MNAFALDAGRIQLATQSPGQYVSAVAAGDDRVVWTIVTRADGGVGYASAQFAWVKVAVQAGLITSSAEPPGPNIPAAIALSQLSIGGDYAATLGCTNGAPPVCTLYVANLATSKLWSINARPGGNAWVKLLAAGPNEIVLGEQDNLPADAQWFPRIVRLRTAQLDALQAAW